MARQTVACTGLVSCSLLRNARRVKLEDEEIESSKDFICLSIYCSNRTMFLCALLAVYTQISIMQYASVISFAGCGSQVTPHRCVLGLLLKCSKVGSLDASEIKATHRAKGFVYCGQDWWRQVESFEL